METELILSRGGLPPLSARGCSQELTPRSLGQFRRTVNGNLVFLGVEGKKYHSLIRCEDTTVLATDDILLGMEVEVQCIQRLWQKTEGGRLLLERDPVPGSIYALDAHQQPISLVHEEGREMIFESKGLAYICYRPILKMRVLSYALMTDEWGMKSGWRLELEEI